MGTVLLCMVALILILLTAGTVAVSHLRFATAEESADHARNLAEAALAEALTQLVQSDFKFGKRENDSGPPVGPGRVEVTIADLPGATGVVTFNKRENGFSRGYSTNNSGKDGSVLGAGDRLVPGRSVHVIARGRVGSTERWVECVYYRPPFPDGIACTGKVDARSVYLAAVRNAGSFDPSREPPVAAEDALAANIFSNAGGSSAGPGTSVSGASTVLGSVGSVGSVNVTPDCDIRGEILPGSEARDIPDLRLDEKFSIVEQNNTPVSSTSGDLTLEPNFFMLAEGGLDVGGDLDLNGSVLLVKGGDLKVTGGLKGTGILLCERDLEIRGGRSSFESAEQVAIGCKGSFRLHAESPENNFFSGLVYAEGDIEAKDITVVGALVANGKRGKAGNVSLDNVRYIYNPGSLEVVAFPPLVTAREWEGRKEVQLSIAGASIRPSSDGKNWLVNAWVGIQLTKTAWIDGKGPKDPRGEHFRGVDEREWNYEKVKAISPLTFKVQTWTDILIEPGDQYFEDDTLVTGEPSPEELLARQQAKAYEKVMKEYVVPWLDINDGESETPEKKSWYDRMSKGVGDDDFVDDTTHIREIVNSHSLATTNQKESKVIHFNLNNLLAELTTNTSRVMLWRPIERP